MLPGLLSEQALLCVQRLTGALGDSCLVTRAPVARAHSGTRLYALYSSSLLLFFGWVDLPFVALGDLAALPRERAHGPDVL